MMKAVIFDVYRTLIDIRTDENDLGTYESIARWLSSKGVRITPRKLFDGYARITRELIESASEPYPDVEIGDVFRRLIAAEGKGKIDAGEGFIKELSFLFRTLTTRSLVIFPHTEFVLRRLSGKTRLAIVSNSQRLFTLTELEHFGIARYFEYILFSSDIGACKPNPKIFRKALNDLKIQPSETVYVGDDLFNDVSGAKKLGMKTVWINHGTSSPLPRKNDAPVPDAELRIDDCHELPEIISQRLSNGKSLFRIRRR